MSSSSSSAIRYLLPDANGVAEIVLCRPKNANALRPSDLYELRDALKTLDALNTEHAAPGRGPERREVRVCVLRGEGRNFCGGIDLLAAAALFGYTPEQLTGTSEARTKAADTSRNADAVCVGRERELLLATILKMQAAITAIEEVTFPVVACVQGACFGLGIDIISACDVVICEESTRFCVKEVDLAITADMGVLQRLPRLVGLSHARELALTARIFSGSEAKMLGLVAETVPTSTSRGDADTELQRRAAALAHTIATKPSIAVRGTKYILNGRFGSNASGTRNSLEKNALLNAATMISNQLEEKLRGGPKPRL